MVSPKSLIKELYSNFELIEALVRVCKECPAISKDDVFSLAKAVFKQNQEDADNAIRALINKEILFSLDQGDNYIVQQHVKEFFLHLIKEQDLGLESVVAAQLENLRRISGEIQKGLDSSDLSLIHSRATELTNRIEETMAQLRDDRDAIRGIIEKAKMLPADTPMSVRYRDVLDCYNQYVEPMVSMLDQEDNGFQNLTHRIEDQLKEGIDLFNRIQGITKWQSAMNSTIVQIHLLRDLIRENLILFKDELSPLRNDVLKNNALSRAVTAMLSKIRKKNSVRRVVDVSGLRLGISKRAVRMTDGPVMRRFAADVLGFVPAKVVFPEDFEKTSENDFPIRLETLLNDVEMFHGKIFLMQWLKNQYPSQGEQNLLNAYLLLLQNIPDKLKQMDEEQSVDLVEHRMYYYPHILEN
ncbi:hypothetical protein IKQ19_12080 [Candidatus Saccharibacteria bacterium]|nr:hypothetical protein [Candidatus Saccharibacteria bacterium]